MIAPYKAIIITCRVIVEANKRAKVPSSETLHSKLDYCRPYAHRKRVRMSGPPGQNVPSNLLSSEENELIFTLVGQRKQVRSLSPPPSLSFSPLFPSPLLPSHSLPPFYSFSRPFPTWSLLTSLRIHAFLLLFYRPKPQLWCRCSMPTLIETAGPSSEQELSVLSKTTSKSHTTSVSSTCPWVCL